MPLDLRTISDQVVEDVDDDVVVGDDVDLRPRELHVDQDPLHRRQHQPRNRARGRVQCAHVLPIAIRRGLEVEEGFIP